MRDPGLGVVVVSFNCGADTVLCLETVLAAARAAGCALRVVVVDDDSTDDTVMRLRAWASGAAPAMLPEDLPFAPAPLPKPVRLAESGPDDVCGPQTQVHLIHSGSNLGFAGGVNLGLRSLAARPEIRHFWVLNPDTLVPPAALSVLAAHLPQAGPYALMGGRVCYLHNPRIIQIDGGRIHWRTGATSNLNWCHAHDATPLPAAGELDFIMGGSMIASRAFYERAGPLREDYFLYYEEVDWAMRRGDLPLAVCDDLLVYHRAGGSIGSPNGRNAASLLSLYFKHRARRMFLRRFNPRAIPIGYAYTLGIAAKEARNSGLPQARAVLAGGFGFGPPKAVAARLGAETAARFRHPAPVSGKV